MCTQPYVGLVMTEAEETIRVLDHVGERLGPLSDCSISWSINTAPPTRTHGQSIGVALQDDGKFWMATHEVFDSGYELLERLAAFSRYVSRLLAEPMDA